jgi:hypothetical protein
MAKEPKFVPRFTPINYFADSDPDLPTGSEDYPGRERFGDWDLEGIVPLNPGEVLVNDDPEGDPDKLARQGEKKPTPKAK